MDSCFSFIGGAKKAKGKLDGHVVIVTGATSGLGEAAAKMFAAQGAKVVATGRRQANGDKVVAAIKAAGGDAIFVKADVASDADCKRMVDETLAKYGKLTGAFNNAGVAEPAVGCKDEDGQTRYGLEALRSTGNLPTETFKKVVDINLTGVYRCCKHQINAMLKNGAAGGSIVNCSSIYGLRAGGTAPGLGVPGYCSSKHGVTGLTKAIALEYAQRGIRCNSVHPGFCASEMTDLYYADDSPGGLRDFIKMIQPLDGGRWGLDTEIANAVSFCLSSEASWYTGQQIVFDGGCIAGITQEAIQGACLGLAPHWPEPTVVKPPRASDGNVRGKVIIVTGATSGLGEATAKMLAKEGAIVVCTGRREENGKKIVAAITSMGGKAMFVKADVSKEADCKRIVDETMRNYGKLDGAFNNAGVAEPSVGKANPEGGERLVGLAGLSQVGDMPEEQFQAVLDVNLHGVHMCCKYQVQAMEKTGGGSIVNCSSIYGLRGSHMGAPCYVATKHAVVGLTKSIACEYGCKGIRANTVHPGYVQSEMTDIFFQDPTFKKCTAIMQPLDGGRWGLDSEIANGVTYLLSDKSSWQTGSELVLDGGCITTLLADSAITALGAGAAGAAEAAKKEGQNGK